jgi:hypothetical protein
MNLIEKNINNNIIYDNNSQEEDNDDNTNEITCLKNEERELQLSTFFKREPSCELIVIDNFYNNPIDTRNYILTQYFIIKRNFPGQRTKSYANEELKEIIQKYIEPFAGKITKKDNSDDGLIYNGSFQYTTSTERSWVHTDKLNNWAGIIFLNIFFTKLHLFIL